MEEQIAAAGHDRQIADLVDDQQRSAAEIADALARLAEEGRKPESIFDFVQGITALARDKPHQDARLDLKGRAKKLLDRAA